MNNMSKFSPEQQKIIQLVTTGHNVYVGGIGGCGKTFVANHILQLLRTNQRKFACACTTGIACTQYQEFCAQTIHSFSGIGQCLGSKEGLLRNVLSNEECVKRWKETEVLFIDEVSMLSQRTFEIINYIGQTIRNSEYAFGGIQIVAFGDFLQLPPVPSCIDSRLATSLSFPLYCTSILYVT